MNLEDRNNETIDMNDEYEMIPFEPMMYGYGEMNTSQSMGMPMGYTQDSNRNMEMNPWTGMYQNNGDMFMNGSNPMDMMYGDTSMNDYTENNEDFRQLDKYGDEDQFKVGYNRVNPKYNDVDSIVRRIEKFNPVIFRLMTRVGMPYAEARDIVRRIVKLTLMYSEE